MKQSRIRNGAVLALVLVSCASVLLAVEIGGSFTGTLEGPGDTVAENFFAAEGARVRIAVEAVPGSTLEPTVEVTRAGGGAPLGSSQQISWLPFSNLVHYVTIPETGQYDVVIGTTAGNGGFWANISGKRTEVPTVSLSGTVTDSFAVTAISGVSVLVNDVLFDTTDNGGNFDGSLPAGSYRVDFQAAGYVSATRAVDLSPGMPVVLDVVLVPSEPVAVDASFDGDEEFGGMLTGAVDVTVPPGVDYTVEWTQVYGVPVEIVGANTLTPTVTLGTERDYKDELIHVLSEPPIGEEDLPPNVPIPAEEFPAGLQNRLQVVGINPFALEEAGLVVLEVTVTPDDSELDAITEEVEIHVDLPWKVSTGLRNVPVGVPVLLHAEEQDSYLWQWTAPSGSRAALADADTRNPYFTPEVKGLYVLEVSDGMPGRETSILHVYAGTWRGIIDGQDTEGRPLPDSGCLTCHNDGDGLYDAADQFTPWAQTGHAEIFTNSLDTNSHYSSNCFSCHTVGYDVEVENNGFDDAEDYGDFLSAGLLSNPGDNWTTVVDEFPETARLANVQCESCHGPNDSFAHGSAFPPDEPRVDISSDVCATCHGEPLRHARFQQWQLSGHANYEVAIDEGDSGSCSRCHTGNGFLQWLPILLDDDPETDPTADLFACDDDVCVGGTKEGAACEDDIDCASWTLDEVHPQTCATCHDPHAPGTTSGSSATNATVRISGDTPPLIAGFQATDVGRGAICMTCHNSRRGLRNDDVFDEVSASDRTRAAHGSAQTDVLMGQNAYFTEVGLRGGHSRVEDACVACHMEATPPPDVLSYNLGGTNHTFYADVSICSDCHGPNLRASDVQDGVQHLMNQLREVIEDRLLDVIQGVVADGREVVLNASGSNPDGDAIISDANVDDVVAIEYGEESRGRQAVAVVIGGDRETFGPYSVASIQIRIPGETEFLGDLWDFAGDEVIKGGWNWHLINNDGSMGIHNPFFASSILAAARDAIVANPPDAPQETAVEGTWKLMRGRERRGNVEPESRRAVRPDRRGR